MSDLKRFAPFHTRRTVAARYARSIRTIIRWEADPDLGFPQPIDINGRKLHSDPLLTQWERKRAGKSLPDSSPKAA